MLARISAMTSAFGFAPCGPPAHCAGFLIPPAAAPTGKIAEAAKKFLATLDEAQRGKVIFDFKNSAQRKRWSNFPTSFVKRAGLRMGDLTKPWMIQFGGHHLAGR